MNSAFFKKKEKTLCLRASAFLSIIPSWRKGMVPTINSVREPYLSGSRTELTVQKNGIRQQGRMYSSVSRITNLPSLSSLSYVGYGIIQYNLSVRRFIPVCLCFREGQLVGAWSADGESAERLNVFLAIVVRRIEGRRMLA